MIVEAVVVCESDTVVSGGGKPVRGFKTEVKKSVLLYATNFKIMYSYTLH